MPVWIYSILTSLMILSIVWVVSFAAYLRCCLCLPGDLTVLVSIVVVDAIHIAWAK